MIPNYFASRGSIYRGVRFHPSMSLVAIPLDSYLAILQASPAPSAVGEQCPSCIIMHTPTRCLLASKQSALYLDLDLLCLLSGLLLNEAFHMVDLKAAQLRSHFPRKLATATTLRFQPATSGETGGYGELGLTCFSTSSSDSAILR